MSRGVGLVQERVLAVLFRGIDGEFVALETTYLKSLVGGSAAIFVGRSGDSWLGAP